MYLHHRRSFFDPQTLIWLGSSTQTTCRMARASILVDHQKPMEIVRELCPQQILGPTLSSSSSSPSPLKTSRASERGVRWPPPCLRRGLFCCCGVPPRNSPLNNNDDGGINEIIGTLCLIIPQEEKGKKKNVFSQTVLHLFADRLSPRT